MTKKLLMTVVTIVMIIGPGLSLAPARQENTAHMGPGYEKGQQSQKTLTFAIPQGWVRDEEGAKKLGLHSVLVPSGMKFENADRMITIAFQKQDSKKPGLENLKNFVKVDLQDTLAQFPDAQFATEVGCSVIHRGLANSGCFKPRTSKQALSGRR
jgi:hypothetical protein